MHELFDAVASWVHCGRGEVGYELRNWIDIHVSEDHSLKVEEHAVEVELAGPEIHLQFVLHEAVQNLADVCHIILQGEFSFADRFNHPVEHGPQDLSTRAVYLNCDACPRTQVTDHQLQSAPAACGPGLLAKQDVLVLVLHVRTQNHEVLAPLHVGRDTQNRQTTLLRCHVLILRTAEIIIPNGKRLRRDVRGPHRALERTQLNDDPRSNGRCGL
mmetsp:Transcript_8885/g.21249  ORF Transcript_8885/g.21249 Transcript_8885/m.21249 type:complete len:215 (+) Transcript_8885:917-1561(+)